ncbi:MAG: hypothetical protein QW292_06185 [Candidatus Parvarchaeota archaeon]
MRISKDDAKVIRRGYFPPVLKDSPYLEGILKRSIRNGIIRALGQANKMMVKNQASMLWELIKNSYFFFDIMGYPYK